MPVVNPANVYWTKYEPIANKENPLEQTPTPYEEHIDFSFERELDTNTLFRVSYVGTFGHHLIVSGDNNPGDPALCLSLPGCGPFGENGTYTDSSCNTVNGNRGPFGPLFGDNSYQEAIGKSTYNALETTLRHNSGRLAVLFSYTYSKAMDNGSGFGDQILLYGSHNQFRSLSAYDMPNNFAASYAYEPPFDQLLKMRNQLTRGWKLSGLTQFTKGVAISMSEPDDQSLTGNTGLIYYGSTDEPNYTPSGSLFLDRNPRHRMPYINPALFSRETLGQQGTSPRRFFHGAGLDNWNLALLKDIKFKEKISLEIRAEFF